MLLNENINIYKNICLIVYSVSFYYNIAKIKCKWKTKDKPLSTSQLVSCGLGV